MKEYCLFGKKGCSHKGQDSPIDQKQKTVNFPSFLFLLKLKQIRLDPLFEIVEDTNLDFVGHFK